ncbi:MAG: terminase gpA endonuclease subunit [Planctomycetota bacterium]
MARGTDAKAAPTRKGEPDAYARHKESARLRQLDVSEAGRDIGAIPPVVDPERREAARLSLQSFLLTYCGGAFPLPFCDDHVSVIEDLQRVIMGDGQKAVAMPRGSGKTTIIARTALWALLFAHRSYVAVIGADIGKARDVLQGVTSELENNDLILEDFPATAHPIRKLEGIRQRAKGQLYDGRPTLLHVTDQKVVLPTITGEPASGSLLQIGGLTGAVRGLNHTRPVLREDGTVGNEIIRPDVVLLDDPQTDESAHSPKQCERRESLANGAIMGLGGPGASLAALAAVTVIAPDDLADRMLDRERNPQWQGTRTKLVYKWPENEDLWLRYGELYREGMQAEPPTLEPAFSFYKANRDEMDRGAEVAWPERFNAKDGELSAIQHAYNLRITRKEAAFHAEYQNEPLADGPAGAEIPDEKAIAARLSGIARGVVPDAAELVTAFVDVQGNALFYVVCAWSRKFDGWVIDYGTEPEQRREYFTNREIKYGLRQAAARDGKRGGLEASIRWGLDKLGERLLGRDWPTEAGGVTRISRMLIDSGWGESNAVVRAWCKSSAHSAVVFPSHGRGVGPSDKPMHEKKTEKGDRRGHNWLLAKPKAGVRLVTYDTNAWKSFVMSRLATPMGDPGTIQLYGDEARRHRLIAEHLSSEYRVATEGRGRIVDVFKLRAGRTENHWLDGVVGCSVAASMEGASMPSIGGPMPAVRKRRRKSLREIQERRAIA